MSTMSRMKSNPLTNIWKWQQSMSSQATMPGRTERGLRARVPIHGRPPCLRTPRPLKNTNESNFLTEYEVRGTWFEDSLHQDRHTTLTLRNVISQHTPTMVEGAKKYHRPLLLTAVACGASEGDWSKFITPKSLTTTREFFIKERNFIGLDRTIRF